MSNQQQQPLLMTSSPPRARLAQWIVPYAPGRPVVTATALFTAEMLVLSLLHFALAYSVAWSINRMHAALWPLPRTERERQENRAMYAGHVALFLPLLCAAYVHTERLCMWLFRAAFRVTAQSDTDKQSVATLMGSIGHTFGFAWGSRVTLTKMSYLTGDQTVA